MFALAARELGLSLRLAATSAPPAFFAGKFLLFALLLLSISACTTVMQPSLPCEGARASWPFQAFSMERIRDVNAEGQAHIFSGIPFGAWNDGWVALIGEMSTPADELWRYKTRRIGNEPERKDAQEGYVVLRSCKVTAQFITIDAD